MGVEFMKFAAVLPAIALAALTAVLSSIPLHRAGADDTGFAASHTLRNEAGRKCFADHFHSGSGDGLTKQAAKSAAAKSWAEFTAFEYGTDWARFGRATGVSVRYTKLDKGWSATIDARPCR